MSDIGSDTFAEIEALSGGCESTGCQHDGESGCAVAAAVASGALEAARLASFHEVRREARGVEAKAVGPVVGRRRLEQQMSRVLRAELKRRRR